MATAHEHEGRELNVVQSKKVQHKAVKSLWEARTAGIVGEGAHDDQLETEVGEEVHADTELGDPHQEPLRDTALQINEASDEGLSRSRSREASQMHELEDVHEESEEGDDQLYYELDDEHPYELLGHQRQTRLHTLLKKVPGAVDFHKQVSRGSVPASCQIFRHADQSEAHAGDPRKQAFPK